MQEEALLIAGPTASGKSALALEEAERLGGVVINADSMQVYAEIRILSARPTAAEEARAPHLLYGHVPAARRYSTGAWLADVAAAIAEVRAAGRFPIIVGGTGLYFKALTEGLAKVPPIPPSIRQEVAEIAVSLSPEMLHERLALVDPKGAATIRPSDPARIVRALEVILATGRPLGDWQRDQTPPVLRTERCRRLVVVVERDELYRRIEGRVDRMLSEGALAEARALSSLGLDPVLPAMKAIGVKPLLRHLAGEIGLDEAAEAIKLDTRHYAKRQMTWFRNQIEGWEERRS